MNRRSLILGSTTLPLITTTANTETFADNMTATPTNKSDFLWEPFELSSLPESDYSFTEDLLQVIGSGGYFEDDVKLYKIGDKVYEHPLTVSQYVMRLINTYRLTGDELYLQHAELNLDHITQMEEIFDGRGLYPYGFDYRLTSEPNGKLIAPWVSGMTQGQVLQAYNRHIRFTGSDRYKEFASRVLASFRLVNDSSVYWSPTVDRAGNLWLEEYPGDPPTETLNGHIFAIYGLYEQWLMTQDPWLLDTIRGSIATVKNRAMSYRREGTPSRYWAISEKYADRYHVIHIAQLLELYSMTGDVKFAQMADIFWLDYPPYAFSGRFYLEPGKYEAIHFDSDKPSINFGEPEQIELVQATLVRTSQRRRLPEQDEFWYLCSSSPFTRMWIKEDPSNGVHSAGEYVGTKSIGGPLHGSRMIYSPARIGKTKRPVYQKFNEAEMTVQFPRLETRLSQNLPVSILARELISGDDYTLIDVSGSRAWVLTELIEYDV